VRAQREEQVQDAVEEEEEEVDDEGRRAKIEFGRKAGREREKAVRRPSKERRFLRPVAGCVA
jgi:hypothetical protein